MTAMYMRLAALVLVVAGFLMFINAVGTTNLLDSSFKGILVLIHLAAALSLIGFWEVSLARKRRESGQKPPPLALIGRILITAVFAFGIYIVVTRLLNTLDNDLYKTLVWIHAPLGIVAIGLAEAVMGMVGRKR
jgi:membrane protease YdiL (CAAX protease family)